MSEFQVTIRDTEPGDLVITDQVTREPNRIDIILSDVISIADRIVFPRRISVTEITPARGRDGESITIKGTGFATSTGQNRVTFTGFPATVTSASEDELVVTTPFLLSIIFDFMSVVTVQSPPFTGPSASGLFFVKLPVDQLADEAPEIERAGAQESIGTDRPTYAEATDWLRLLDVVDVALGNGAGAGSLMAHDGIGPTAVDDVNPTDNGEDGQVLLVDPGEPTLLGFGWDLDFTLPFGGEVVASPGGAVLLRASGDQLAATGANSAHGATLPGTLNLAWLLVKEASTDTLDRVRVLVEGSSVFDSGAGLGLVNDQTWVARFAAPVNKEDEIELEVTKSGTAATMRLIGGVRLGVR